MSDPAWTADLLTFWFDEIGEEGWWSHSPEVDALCAARFGALHEAEKGRPVEAFLDSPGQALAAVLLFDQISRNLFRDSADAFATDGLAIAIARGAIARSYDDAMPETHRQFLYMPFMHSEELADQERSVQLFESLDNEEALDFARKHRDLIARFGRFPHRNAVLCRETLPREKEAVEQGADW